MTLPKRSPTSLLSIVARQLRAVESLWRKTQILHSHQITRSFLGKWTTPLVSVLTFLTDQMTKVYQKTTAKKITNVCVILVVRTWFVK